MLIGIYTKIGIVFTISTESSQSSRSLISPKQFDLLERSDRQSQAFQFQTIAVFLLPTEKVLSNLESKFAGNHTLPCNKRKRFDYWIERQILDENR